MCFISKLLLLTFPLECNTRYYANYWVNKKDSTQTYYRGSFKFLHIAEAVFIETRTLELFTTMILTAW
jgi:hypothetical protein